MNLSHLTAWLFSVVLVVAVTFQLPASDAATAVYRWTDAQGRVHYDDQSTAKGQRLTREDVEHRAIQAMPDWAGSVPVAFSREVLHRCTLARERAASDGAARQVYVRDAAGQVHAVAPAQLRSLRADSQREINRYCSAEAPGRLYRERPGRD